MIDFLAGSPLVTLMVVVALGAAMGIMIAVLGTGSGD